MSEKSTGTKKPTAWRIKRYFLYAMVTVIVLILPWIQVDGNHFFLLSFDKLKLHLAFVQFDMQELYLMPFLLMIMFLGIFGMTVMGGRVFCGWVCPQTVFRVIYRDLIETKILGLRGRIKNKQKEPDMTKPENKVKKVIAVLMWVVLSLIASSNFMWYFVPPEDFFSYISDINNHWVLFGAVFGISAFLIYDIVWMKENFCVYVCPYSRIQSVLYDEHTVMALYNEHRGGVIYDGHDKKYSKQKDIVADQAHAECTACESCVTVCPTHIDIRQGLQLECINCLECVDACTTVMGKLGKESLVTWSSDYEIVEQKGKTKYFRPKVLAYGAILVALVIIIAVMGSKKEHMLLNINKETKLYSTTALANDKVKVDNAYIFLVQNTQAEKMKYYFEVIPPKGMEGKIFISKPSKPFMVTPGFKKKKIVILSTTDMLVDNARKDTVIPIQIRAYALDKDGKQSKKIVVFRKSTFIFPKKDILESSK